LNLQIKNYYKQKGVYTKYQIDNKIQSSKEVVSKLTGIPINNENKDGEPINEEDALLESLNNLDYLLVQQKMDPKEKEESRIKLAEHMGMKPEIPKPELKKEISKSRGIRKKMDEIKSQRSEILEPDAKNIARKPKGKEMKYSEVKKGKKLEKNLETQSEIIDMKSTNENEKSAVKEYGEIPEENDEMLIEKNNEETQGVIKEKVKVNPKFNIKDILV